ncbi:MAG: polyamine oxidase, partial [Acidimicrobiaceae bacterium]|nr:polyamine oxidase [Acidimicrobiaceae bacterium]
MTSVDGAEVRTVVVVGAGISGLAAGRALHDAGVDVVVVEGRDRTGGRTHTVEVEGVPVDLGASWIHNGAHSPMLDYVDSLGIERMPAVTSTIALTAAVFDQTTGDYPALEARSALTGAMAGFAMAGAQVEQLGPGLDVAEAMAKVLSAVDPAIRRTLGALLSMNEGKDDDDMSFDFLREHFFGGGEMHEDSMPRGGYRRVVDALCDGLTVHLETTVERIVQAGDGVTVHTSSGSFDASHVLVTVPLGVLKAKAIEFEPPLPTGHLEAIERMGFGVLEKVVIAYDSAAWQVDGAPTNITIVETGGPTWPMIIDLSAWYGVPVAVGLATGTRGQVLAGLPEAERVAALHETICALSPGDAPTPVATTATSWATDPFVLGCYANIALGTSPEQHVTDIE